MPENDQNLWEQVQGYGTQLGSIQSQLGSLQNILNSGQVMTMGDQGMMTVGGGTNRYGEARPGTVLMRGQDGNLDPRFMQSLTPEMQALQAKAMTEGDTQAAMLARERQGIMAQGSRDSLQRQGASALSGGMRNLAMRGGAGLGSRERLNRDISRGIMSGNQGINRENRLANLAISQNDEAMKNQLLGQVGITSQKIQEANINRLQQDVQAQNLAAHNIYGEDMRAFAADKSASAQAAASSCFTGETLFLMEDGTLKNISAINLGDRLKEGGEVFFKTQSYSDDMYLYDDEIKVSGTHAVKEDGEWIRVGDSKKVKTLDGKWLVYNLGTENHIMLTQNHCFSDFFETDDYEELSIGDSLKVLNGKLD